MHTAAECVVVLIAARPCQHGHDSFHISSIMIMQLFLLQLYQASIMCACKYAHPTADNTAAASVPLLPHLQLDAKMPDPRSITTKPEHRLLRARAFKRNPTCSFTLEVTGKHQLSTSNHEQVKWVPAAPDNASWADTVEYKWESKVYQD
jgi:hypothetical protein